MTTHLGFNIQLPLAFGEAVVRVKDALKQEGFGILTEVDLQAAFREKLGRDFRPYVILGACNPTLAYSAIHADPAVGLLLPCNVTVESVGERRTVVQLTDPEALLSGVHETSADVAGVANDARERMMRVRNVLQGTSS